MKLILALLLTLGLAGPAAAASTISLFDGEQETITVLCTAPGEECPPAPSVEYLKSYGKAHGGNHTKAAKAPGAYEFCTQCHRPNTDSGAISIAYSFCPAKEAVKFANPKILTALGYRIPVMLGQQLPLETGGFFRDTVLDQDIVCGGDLGCYARDEVPLCIDCHHHDGKPSEVALAKADIHAGCLDCHTGVRNGNLKRGIKNALEGIIED